MLIWDEVYEDELDVEEEEDFCKMLGNFVIEFYFKWLLREKLFCILKVYIFNLCSYIWIIYIRVWVFWWEWIGWWRIWLWYGEY